PSRGPSGRRRDRRPGRSHLGNEPRRGPDGARPGEERLSPARASLPDRRRPLCHGGDRRRERDLRQRRPARDGSARSAAARRRSEARVRDADFLAPDRLISLRVSVGKIPRLGPARAARLSAAGLATVGDFLLALPFRYEDRRRYASVATLAAGEAATLLVRLTGVRLTR